MMMVKGSRFLVVGAASVVAALLLTTALRAEVGAEGVDSGAAPGAVLLADATGSGDEGGLIPVDPGVPVSCEGDCTASGDGVDSGGDAGGDDGVTEGGDGTGDGGWTDDTGTDGSGDQGGADEGGSDLGDTGGDTVPDGIFTINGDCIDCNFVPMADGPRADSSGGPAVRPVRHARGGTDLVGRGPDLCIDHPPALDWICNWQSPAR